MVLIGQRMPLLLTFLGLFATALLLQRLRGPVLLAAAACGVLLAALPTLSPQAAHRVESKFASQMADLPDSHYGQIAARSVAIVREHPWFGAGFDGFRRLCADPAYFQGWPGGDGGGAAICVQHPHSYYLQARSRAGSWDCVVRGACGGVAAGDRARAARAAGAAAGRAVRGAR